MSQINGNENDQTTDEITSEESTAGRRLPCCVHGIQLLLKDAAKASLTVDKIIKEASAVVGFFHRSLYWGSELKKLSGGLALLASVLTR